MSIDVQTEIRNTCLYKGGPFAVLMAMADCANTASGEGVYPGIDLLAANARLEIRATQDNIKRLRADLVVVLVSPDGEDLGPEVQPTGGRGRKTEYRIDLQRVHQLQGLHEAEAGVCQFCEAREKRRMMRLRKGAFSSTKGAENTAKGAISDVKGAESHSHIRTHEPSLEPSGEKVEASPPSSPHPQGDLLGDVQQPSTPAEVLTAAYAAYDLAAQAAGWARVQLRTPARDASLTKRLKESGGLPGWQAALDRALASDWCCGKVPPRDERPAFKADFDFLIQQKSFVKLMEGKYDNRQGPGSGGGGSRAIAAGVAARRAARRADGHQTG